MYGCSITFVVTDGRKICQSCPKGWKKRSLDHFNFECVENCPDGEFQFEGRCLGECPTGTFTVSGASTSQCFSSCPSGYLPDGNQCNVKLTKRSRVRIGLSVTFGLLCVCMFVLWLVLKIYFTSKDNKAKIKTAEMRAI